MLTKQEVANAENTDGPHNEGRPSAAPHHMVAAAFGTMAVQSLAAGEAGLMMALRDGNYETVPIETCIQGEKRVDVEELYDADAYRPIIRTVRGKPMYLY